MPEARTCSICAAPMQFRLGGYECPACGRMEGEVDEEPAAEVEPANQPSAAEEFADSGLQDPGDAVALPPPPSTGPDASAQHRLLTADTGNTSGMGAGHPLPREAQGWTNAAFIPAGLFSFVNGNTTWGVIVAVGYLVSVVGLVYFFMVGYGGRADAWRCRRFSSVEEYVATMEAWHKAGSIVMWVSVAVLLLVLAVVIAIGWKDLAALKEYQSIL
jgi:hypothetical protein